MADILWELGAAEKRRTRMAAFIEAQRAGGESGLPAPDAPDAFARLHRWSITHPDRFWAAVWRYCGVIAGERDGLPPWDNVLVGGDRMAPPDATLGPLWFTGARLNFAENLLAGDDAALALAAWDERGPAGRLTFAELRQAVASCAGALRSAGVAPGDRVAGFLPNIPETVIAMLAATSIGAVWSSCSPDFGAAAVADRFGQIAPRVLICADGYHYAGKRIPLGDRIADVVAALPSVERCVDRGAFRSRRDPTPLADRLPHGSHGAFSWPVSERAATVYERLPFGHPAFILYSSGTTGVPKCIVHGAGGTLLQFLKEHVLHVDVRRDDRVFYHTTCGWMMWNWLVNALAAGAAAVLYDGAALPPDGRPCCWDMAADEGVTVFGTSAKYLALAEKHGLRPGTTHDLRGVRTILSTGSPLAAHSFDYVRRDVGAHIQLASIRRHRHRVVLRPRQPADAGAPRRDSGTGTRDGRRGVRRYRATDHRRDGRVGVYEPFPSMPLRFWNDPDGEKYTAAYFAQYPNVWRHGDWAQIPATAA